MNLEKIVREEQMMKEDPLIKEMEKLRALILTEIEQRGATRIALAKEITDIKTESLNVQRQIRGFTKKQIKELIQMMDLTFSKLQNQQEKNLVLYKKNKDLLEIKEKQLNEKETWILNELERISNEIIEKTNQGTMILNDSIEKNDKRIRKQHEILAESIDKLKSKLEYKVDYENIIGVVKGQILTGLSAVILYNLFLVILNFVKGFF